MGHTGCAYNICLYGKKPLDRLWHKCEDNNITGLTELGWGRVSELHHRVPRFSSSQLFSWQLPGCEGFTSFIAATGR